MNSFNVFRPAFSVVGVGFVAGVVSPQAKREGNIAGRIRRAIEARAAAVAAQRTLAEGGTVEQKVFEKFCDFAPNAVDAERVAWRTIVYLRAARRLGALPTHIETFIGLVPEAQPEVLDTRKLDALLAEHERDLRRSNNRAAKAAR